MYKNKILQYKKSLFRHLNILVYDMTLDDNADISPKQHKNMCVSFFTVPNGLKN